MSRPDAIDLVRRATNMTVQAGLFAGMGMTPLQGWRGGEDIAPQLLGTHEQEQRPALARPMARGARTVVNVGCAEGHDAAGLARRLPGAHVHAFDIDGKARAARRADARENGVGDRVTINGSCGPEEVPGGSAAPDPDPPPARSRAGACRPGLRREPGTASPALSPHPHRQEVPCAWSS